MAETTITTNIQKLEMLFDIFNKKFFDDFLEKPIIAFIPNIGNRNYAYGWCTIKKIWKDKDNGETYYEIAICPEFMDRDIKEISSTLLHEMTHLYNLQRGIQDCSRGNQYHNKKFKIEAEKRGLEISYDKKIGWSLTKLSKSTAIFIDNEIDIKMIPLCRGGKYFNTEDDSDDIEEEKKKTSWKYVCPNCNNSVRATKELYVICGDCNEDMEEEI